MKALLIFLLAGASAQTGLTDDEIITAFKETRMEVPNFPYASEEAKLATITGSCSSLMPSQDVDAYRVRIAGIDNDWLRGFITGAFEESAARGLNVGNDEAGGAMTLNQHICDELLAYSHEQADRLASLIMRNAPRATVRATRPAN